MRKLSGIFYALLFCKMALAAGAEIPEIKNPKHEIGFVCLKEIQIPFDNSDKPPGDSCGQPFKKIKNGVLLPDEFPVPTWAKKPNGTILNRQEWDQIPQEMTGYEENFGFAVFSTRPDAVELRLPAGGNTESIWIPREKISRFFPLTELASCEIRAKNWWNQLYKEDLTTKADIDLNKKIPGDPFRGLEPLGLLQVTRDAKSRVCAKPDSCVAGKVAVDSKLFKEDSVTGERIKTKVTSLNLGSEHFKGETLTSSPNKTEALKTDYLLVMDQKGDFEFQLQSVIYDEPRVWVKIPEGMRGGVKFLPASDKVAAKILAKDSLGVTWFSKIFLDGASLEIEDGKWQGGQFWLKAKVLFVSRCGDASFPEDKILGHYWIPFSKSIGYCPKGC